MHSRGNWKRSVRWFAAEFLVVVTGILVALALNAWWQDRQDAAREQAYLRQLAIDLQTNEQLAEVMLEFMNERIRLGGLLSDAIRTRPLPSHDEMGGWLYGFLGVAPLYPRMGTVQALIETGDLNLIGDTALRTAIIDYAGHVQIAHEMNNKANAFVIRGFEAIHQRVDIEALKEGEQPSLTDWSELAEDPVFRGSISAIQAAYATDVRGAKIVLHESRTLRERVESRLE